MRPPPSIAPPGGRPAPAAAAAPTGAAATGALAPGDLSRAGGGHAVVVGAGMGGLLAARVLSERYARVTLVDRDRLPAGPAVRPGVPQARHVHILLVRGLELLEALFPGLDQELAAAGAPELDWAADCRYFMLGGWKPVFRSGLRGRPCSRALLEWLVRRRVGALAPVRFLEAQEVVGLVPGPAGGRVVGVRLRPRPAPGGAPGAPEAAGAAGGGATDLVADLVVDASGRGSRAPEWLAALGYGRPRETTVDAFVGYASRVYAPPAGFRPGWRFLFVRGTPPAQRRAGGIFPIEGGRWLVSLGGAARDHPPTDEAGFLAFARSLPAPVLYEAIRDATPLTPVAGYRTMENRRRHFERLRRWPAGFVVLGDAACTFNPVYGQGMTVACQEALLLDRCLRARPGHRERPWRRPGDLEGPERVFQRRLARGTAVPWLMATSEDFRFPGTRGDRPGLPTRFLHRYLDGVLRRADRSPLAFLRYLQTVHLTRPPAVLFEPRVAVPVLLGGL
jgi:2-polyprenyl-6-methoxyphenol hydroxylase-like FAD-dependent oxidoreductase